MVDQNLEDGNKGKVRKTFEFANLFIVAASSPGANKISCESLYEGLHEVVHHIIGAQRGVGYERSG